jgi:hypothetical protein
MSLMVGGGPETPSGVGNVAVVAPAYGDTAGTCAEELLLDSV